MNEHGNTSNHIAHEDNSSKAAKDVLSGRAKARTNLTLPVAALLALGNGQGLPSRTFDGGLDKILFLLGVEDGIPCGKRDEGHEQNQRVEVLCVSQDLFGHGEAIRARMGGKGAASVVGRRVVGQHGGKLQAETNVQLAKAACLFENIKKVKETKR